MYGVGDNRLSFSAQTDLSAIRFGELFWREMRAEIPFYAVTQVEGEYLNVQLQGV